MTEPGEPVPAWNEPRERTVCVRLDGTADPYSALTDAELEAMANRAWRESARCWAEYRRAETDTVFRPVHRMLREHAESAESFWRELRDAVIRRASDASDR